MFFDRTEKIDRIEISIKDRFCLHYFEDQLESVEMKF